MRLKIVVFSLTGLVGCGSHADETPDPPVASEPSDTPDDSLDTPIAPSDDAPVYPSDEPPVTPVEPTDEPPVTPIEPPDDTPSDPSLDTASARVDENLERLRALQLFEVGALIVDMPAEATNCYAI